MSKCYKCGADIDSDSLFCDQCGAEQYVCPKCHIIGKGPNKRCGMCGSPLVPATGQQGNNSTQQQGAAQPFAGTTQQQGAAQQQEATRMASYLVCQAEQVSIPLMNGAVIGRTAGDYANLLGKCIYISVMLAQLIKALYNIVDSLFVGKYSESGLTALSIIYPLQLLMIAIAVGTGVGINTAMAHYLGVHDEKKANEYGGIGTPLTLALWVLFARRSFLFS